MVDSPRLPGILQKLQKRPRVDNANKRPRIEECLPPDALKVIMGYLDQETRCTARLVSKTFCAAASAHVCSLTLSSTTKGVSFHRFPQLRHVTVSHRYWEFKGEATLAQLDPRLRDLATALTIEETSRSSVIRGCLSQAAFMPKLRRLAVEGTMKQKAALLARCTNLEAIGCYACSISVARTIVTMRQLTSLYIGFVFKDPARAVYAHISWLGRATDLTNLRALCIGIPGEALPLIGNLTTLTGLTVSHHIDLEPTYSIAPLLGLKTLRSLAVDMEMTERNLGIACSLGSGSLSNLEVRVCEEALAACGRFLQHQTALTRLSLEAWQPFWHIGGLRLELLQCLDSSSPLVMDAEGLMVLCRAMSLTSLGISAPIRQPLMGLSQVLPRLTQLRSLSLESWSVDATKILDVPLALSALTGLTKLRLRSHALDDGGFGALLSLTGLRVLELERCQVTDDMLPQLSSLTNLNSLEHGEIRGFGDGSLEPVREFIGSLREARGLWGLCTSEASYSR